MLQRESRSLSGHHGPFHSTNPVLPGLLRVFRARSDRREPIHVAGKEGGGGGGGLSSMAE